MLWQTIKNILTNDTFGAIIKLFAGLCTAGFGILGIGAKTRDDAGNLTGDGRIALIGILVGLAIGSVSGLYDFVSGQENQRKTGERTQLLLRSAQRGIYPFRGFTANLNLPLNGNFTSLSTYKGELNRALSRDRFCKKPGFPKCQWSGNTLDPSQYLIPATSTLFPPKGSPLYAVLNNLQVRVRLYKANDQRSGTPGRPEYKEVGDFFVTWHNNLEGNASLAYQFKSNSLSLSIGNLAMGSGASGTGGVYSLVDFNPGMIAAYADLADDNVCDEVHMSAEACNKELLDPIFRSLAVEAVQFEFPYPKNIEYDSVTGIECDMDNHHYLVQRLPYDVEEADWLGHIEKPYSAEDIRNICGALQSAEKKKLF